MASLPNDDAAETINGTAAGDTVNPLPLSDEYEWRGANDNDIIDTKAGNDDIYITPGTDSIDGGDDYDVIRVPNQLIMWAENDPGSGVPWIVNPNNFVVDLIAGTYSIDWRSFDDFDDTWSHVVTSSGTFQNIESIRGIYWSDTVWATDGNDVLYVDEGSNALHGRDGYDVLARGTYRVSSEVTDAIIVDAQAGTWIGWDGKTSTFSSIEEFRFDDGDDSFVGSANDEVVLPSSGAGSFNGGGGTDRLSMVGSSGTGVVLDVEAGTVKLKESGVTQTFMNFEEFIGTYHNDTITGSSNGELLSAGWGNDSVTAGGGADRLVGSNGNDTLRGDDGDDVLFGNNDKDKLFGGKGKDYLDGGAGNDRLTGGDGADEFVIYADGSGGVDSLLDFQFGTDTLILI